MLKSRKFFIGFLIILVLLKQIKSWCLKSEFSDSDRINSIDFSRDGSKIVTTSSSKRVIVWNARTLEQLFVYNINIKPNSAKFSKDNTMIAIGFDANNIHVIKVSDYSVITSTLPSSQTLVYQVDFNENTTRLISCGQTLVTNIYTISGTTFNYQTNSGNKNGQNLACKFLKTTNLIAMGNKLSDAFMFDYTATGFGTFNAVRRSTGQTRAVDWNVISEQAYFGGTDKNLYIISKTGNLDRTISINKQIYTISVAQDGGYAAIGGQGGQMYVYNTVTQGSQYLEVTLNQSSTYSLTASAFSADGQYLTTGNDQGMIFIYKRICSGCPSATYANGSSCRACNLDISGCYLCKNSSTCLACANGYFLQTVSTSKVCKQCQSVLAGCNQCNSSTVCVSCIQGYYLDATVGVNTCKLCWDSIKGCLMCNASNYCFACDYRYYLNTSSNTCISCTNITNCLSCNASNYCLECVQGYYQNGSGGCTQCTKNCSNCINGTYCTQCDNSFYLSAGVCALCTVKGCLSCNSSNYCFDCIESMYQNAGACTFCAPPCLECSTTANACETCLVGYYLSGTSCNSCTGITEGCVGCKGSAATDCIACATGYYLNTNTCTQCTNLLTNCAQCNSTLCSVCKLGFYYDSVNNLCKLCSKGCLTCITSTVCLSCQVGYFYTSASNVCTLCPGECSSCQSAAICSSCNPRYYYNSTNQNCTKCSMANCATCKDQATCLSCVQGYFVDNSGALCRQCSVNITNCLSCYNQSYCKCCQLGYFLPTGNASCSQCASPCSTCDSVDCFSCQLGYFLTTVSPKTCSPCAKQCAQCVTALNCSKCVAGYYQDSVTDKCITCENVKPGCRNCNNTVCFSCKYELGYFYNSTDNTCPTCSSKITNCINCQSDVYCLLCKYGYVLSSVNTLCSSCFTLIANCEHCLDALHCQTCLKGYYPDVSGVCQVCTQGCSSCNDTTHCQICLRQYVLEPALTCKLCQDHIMGCEMCRYNPTIQCTNCITGFYLTATTCTLCSATLEGCSICSNSLTCLSCASGYYLSATNKCFTCQSNRPNCQLCAYNSGTTSVDCYECNQGYFLNATFQCQLCLDTSCLTCSSSNTCTRCQTGFYLSAGDCLKCQDLFQGCRLCNDTDCVQCASGFYLNGLNRCQACSLAGCSICSQINPSTQCLSCDSQYYLTGTKSCQLCKVSLPNCLECATTAICQICESGYYVKVDGKCELCSAKYDGCSLCTPSSCLQCQSGYLLNATNLCQLCNAFIPGCSFCLSAANCLSCQSGYYSQANSCNRCSDLTGCLQCRDASTCIFCDYGYYLSAGTCISCQTAITNCVACSSSSICTACLGNFALSAGACTQLKSESFATYDDIKLITEYVSPNQLKHTLKSIGKKIYQIDLNWTLQSKLYLLDQNYDEHTLTITKTQFGDNGYSLIFYTDNPLTNLADMNNMNGMPLLSSSTSSRLLADNFSFNNNFKTKLQMSEQGINSLFPEIHHSGSFFMKYKLSQPQFYRSVLQSKTYSYNYFGVAVSIVLVVLYFAKSVWIAQGAQDKGQIIPHILCYKMMGFIIYPLYGEYLNYCQGFTLLDMPWQNDFLSSTLTISTDASPDTYKLFYNNINLASTYLVALIIIFCVYIVGFLIIKYLLRDLQKWQSFKGFIYNLFICGIVVSSFLSLQGAYYNPVDSLSYNSAFYIIGIGIFVATVLQSFYSIYSSISRSTIPFHKPRIILKCMALTLAYLNPLYIFMSLIFLDICLLIIQYVLKKDKKISPKLWLFNNILIDVGLILMMLGPYSLISLYISSSCIAVVIGIDIFIMIQQNAQLRQIQKVRLRENQLIKTMQALEKQNRSTRSKNNQIYFQNKVMEDLQTNMNTFYKTKSSLKTQNLYFEEKQDEGKYDFDIPITEQQNQNFESYQKQQNSSPPEIMVAKRRSAKTSIKNRKKQEKRDWALEQDNSGTFVLGVLQ